MKNFLIIFFALIIGGVGGYFAWKYLLSDNSGSFAGNRAVSSENYKEKFMWGVTARPSSLGKYVDEVWNNELIYAKGLGVDWVRIAYDHNAGFSFHDEAFSYVKNQGLNIYLVIEPNGDFMALSNSYQDGYEKGFSIAQHYKGQIKYYQLMNEAGSNALKSGNLSGETEPDLDPTKYEKTRDWIKGVSEGIKKADPSAYRVVTNQWTHVVFLNKLINDKVDFDIIGWDWFSDMGYMGEKKLADGTLLIDKLKSYNKPIILAECNRRPEGKNGRNGQNEEKQAEYIQKMATWAHDAGLKGFYVLELLDSPPNQGRNYTDYYGIMSIKQKLNGTWVPDQPRKAFFTYKDTIAKY